jgi:hypothetical protein
VKNERRRANKIPSAVILSSSQIVPRIEAASMQVETRIILLSTMIALVLVMMANEDKFAILVTKLSGML